MDDFPVETEIIFHLSNPDSKVEIVFSIASILQLTQSSTYHENIIVKFWHLTWDIYLTFFKKRLLQTIDISDSPSIYTCVEVTWGEVRPLKWGGAGQGGVGDHGVIEYQ